MGLMERLGAYTNTLCCAASPRCQGVARVVPPCTSTTKFDFCKHKHDRQHQQTCLQNMVIQKMGLRNNDTKQRHFGDNCAHLVRVCMLIKVRTPALPPNERTRVVPCQRGANAQVRVFCAVLEPLHCREK